MANNTEKRITAKMVLDDTGFNNSLRGINSEMKKYQAQTKLASQGIKSFGAVLNRLGRTVKSLKAFSKHCQSK